MSAHRGARLRLAFLFLTVAFGVADAYAQDDAYKRGLGARDDERWSEVATQMRLAIAADSRESARRVDRGVFRRDAPYLPYYFLGEALFRQNDCASAISASLNAPGSMRTSTSTPMHSSSRSSGSISDACAPNRR